LAATFFVCCRRLYLVWGSWLFNPNKNQAVYWLYGNKPDGVFTYWGKFRGFPGFSFYYKFTFTYPSLFINSAVLKEIFLVFLGEWVGGGKSQSIFSFWKDLSVLSG